MGWINPPYDPLERATWAIGRALDPPTAAYIEANDLDVVATLVRLIPTSDLKPLRQLRDLDAPAAVRYALDPGAQQ